MSMSAQNDICLQSLFSLKTCNKLVSIFIENEIFKNNIK